MPIETVEHAVALVTAAVALLSVLGTIATSHRAARKDAFNDLKQVVAILQGEMKSAEAELKVLKDELQQSEARVNELETENAALRRVNAELKKDIDRLSVRLDDSMLNQRK